MCGYLELVEWFLDQWGNIEKFPSKQKYLYLSLAKRKVAEFYQDIIIGMEGAIWIELDLLLGMLSPPL